MSRYARLTDEQWELVKKHLSLSISGGRASCTSDDRATLDAVLWILRTGTCWAALPGWFPCPRACYRRFSIWLKTGVFRDVLETLAQDLENRCGIILADCFIGGSFTIARRGQHWENPNGTKTRGSWVLQTMLVFHASCTRMLLAYLQSPLSQQRSMKISPWDNTDDLLGIVSLQMMRSIKLMLGTDAHIQADFFEITRRGYRKDKTLLPLCHIRPPDVF